MNKSVDTETKKFTAPFGDSEIEIEIGKLANLSSASVTAKWGETVVLATVVVSEKPQEGAEFFPLMVDYEERWYASGKISGSRFIKREARPSDEAVLVSRLIDRSVRPLFPDNYRNDIQIIITVLSTDLEHDSAILSVIAASLALTLSPAPFEGPIGISRVGLIDDKLIFNKNNSEIEEKSKMDLIVCGTKDAVVMIEAVANEVLEEQAATAISEAHQEMQSIIKFQNNIYKELKAEKQIFEDPMKELQEKVSKFLGKSLAKTFIELDKESQEAKIAEFRKSLSTELEGYYKQADIETIFEKEIGKHIRWSVMEKGLRPDGRKLDELRPISAEANLLPRTHGSGLFTRGETQVMSIVTLGAPSREQVIETMEEEATKRYMHHYVFPPFCTGEVRPMRSVSRREIGHGALAEKALVPMLPDRDSFPYTIRVVSEVLSSNGSSSMASVCGSSLALMDAGVPIKKPVAGVSIGLILETPEKFALLTDIQGVEDHSGDMDFKVAGTNDGVTAIQLDVKTKKLTPEILKQAFEKAKNARIKILEIIKNAISQPREKLSEYAPKIETIKIKKDKIREVIGPGGKIINQIIELYKVTIDIEEDGTAYITGEKKESVDAAIKYIENLTKEAKIGEEYEGKIVRILDFGAFVEIFPGQDGMVHISKLADHRVEKVTDVVKLGDIVKVKVINIDEQGRINLSLKEIKNKK